MLPLAGRTVLVVDDEQGFRDLLVEELGACGAAVTAAGNAVEALARFVPGQLDLILTDIRMPGGSGLELLERVKAINPVKPLVVLMTGFSDVTPADAYDKGAEVVLSKPFDLVEVTTMISAMLDPARERWMRRVEAAATVFDVQVEAASLPAAVEARQMSVGRGGAFFAVGGVQPPAGARVAFSLQKAPGLFEGSGICRWGRSSGHAGLPAGIGVEFEFLTAPSLQALKALKEPASGRPFIPKE